MSTLLQDLRFALRGLVKQRGVTLVGLLTLTASASARPFPPGAPGVSIR